MLHYETIDAPTLELLKNLQCIPSFHDLRLVGGTALALQYGHRKSVDLDLFGSINVDEIEISKALNEIGEIIQLKKGENINIYSINNIKVDLVNYPYKWLSDYLLVDNIILAQPPDIGAMKLAAITGRGTKKNFIDLFFLLHNFTLNQLLDFYKEKYPDGSLFLVIRSLSFFEDADNDLDPVMLFSVKWTEVKTYIQSILKEYKI
jgi:hypothetical protein